MAPVVVTISIVLGSNKIPIGDILVPTYPSCPGKWPLNKCHCHWRWKRVYAGNLTPQLHCVL